MLTRGLDAELNGVDTTLHKIHVRSAADVQKIRKTLGNNSSTTWRNTCYYDNRIKTRGLLSYARFSEGRRTLHTNSSTSWRNTHHYDNGTKGTPSTGKRTVAT